jgi:PAS domain S-box-containing protein
MKLEDTNNSQQLAPEVRDDLQELERYIKEFSLFLPLPFCVVNPLGVIVTANQAFCELTEWEDIEIVGEEISRVFKEKKQADELQEKIIRENAIKGYEAVLVTKKGKKIDASISISARKDNEGNLIGYFFAFFDMSELKKFQKGLEEKVKEATSQLREKLDELERFNRLAVGRELKMIELKEEIELLKKEMQTRKAV